MDESHELKNLILSAEDTKGFCIKLAHEIQDSNAKQMYTDLSREMDNHLEQLHKRRNQISS